MILAFLLKIANAEETWGYELMKTGLLEFCDDNFLIDSSIQETELGCLEQCATTGDPGNKELSFSFTRFRIFEATRTFQLRTFRY